MPCEDLDTQQFRQVALKIDWMFKMTIQSDTEIVEPKLQPIIINSSWSAGDTSCLRPLSGHVTCRMRVFARTVLLPAHMEASCTLVLILVVASTSIVLKTNAQSCTCLCYATRRQIEVLLPHLGLLEGLVSSIELSLVALMWLGI